MLQVHKSPHSRHDTPALAYRRKRRFQIFENRGKGSHRMIYHPDIGGRAASMPIPFHKGNDVRQGILKALP